MYEEFKKREVKKKMENEKQEQMKQLFEQLSEENQNILIMVANGIKIGQENGGN